MINQRQLLLDSVMKTDMDIVIVDNNSIEYGYPVSSVNYNYAVKCKQWQAGQVYTKSDLVISNGSIYYVISDSPDSSVDAPVSESVYRNFESTDGIVWRKFAVPYNTYEIGSHVYACILNSIVNTPQTNAIESIAALSLDVTGTFHGILTKSGIGAVPVIGSRNVYVSTGGIGYKSHDLYYNSTSAQTGSGFVGNVILSGGVITGITILNGGTGYTQNSKIIVAGDGVGFNCELEIDVTGSVTGINILSGGTNYNVADPYVVNQDVSVYPIQLEPTNGIGYDVLNLPVDYYIIVDKTVEIETQISATKIKLSKKKKNSNDDYVDYAVSTLNEISLSGTHQLKYLLKFSV